MLKEKEGKNAGGQLRGEKTASRHKGGKLVREWMRGGGRRRGEKVTYQSHLAFWVLRFRSDQVFSG